MSSAGTAMTVGITTPLMAVGTASVNMASDFETSMAKVATIANTDTSKGGVALETLEQQIMDLSKQTGISASEIAGNVYDAISAGQETGDAVNFVKNATKLAKAGFTSSGSALDILTTAMNAYGMSADEVTHVSDVLITTQNLGKTTVDQLAASMGKVIPTAKANGVGMEDLAGCYAVMTANGIATAETTTYLNSMLNELGKKGSTAADAFAKGTEHIKEGGLTMKEAMEQGWELTDILSILDEQAAESGTSISNMFGSAEAGKAATVLLDNAGKLNEDIDAMAESAKATETAFLKMDSTTAASMEKMKNSAMNTLIALGDTILPYVIPAVETLTGKIQELTGWFQSLSPETKSMIVKIAGIAAAAGPALAIGGKAVSIFGGIGAKLGSLASAAGGLTGKLTTMKPAATGGSSALRDLSKNATGLLALGAAILMISAGFWILSQAAISLANAGPLAIGVMAGLVVAIGALSAVMMLIMKSLAPMAPKMMSVSIAMLAMGAAVLMIASGFWIMTQATIALVNAGTPAIAVFFGMVGAIAALMAVAAALGPALTAGAIGFVAFGVAILAVGAGALMAAAALAVIAGVLPTLSTYGLSGATAIAALGASIMILAAGAVVAGAAAVVLGAGLVVLGAGSLVGAAGMAAFAVAVAASAAATLLLKAGLVIVNNSMKSISKNAKSAESSLSNMESSIDIVSAGLKSVGDMAKSAVSSLVSAFKKGESDARASATSMTTGITNTLQKGLSKLPPMAVKIMGQFASGINSGGKLAIVGISATGVAIIATMQSYAGSANNAGLMIGMGLARGMDASRGAVMASAAALAAAANQAIQAKAKIGSPSRVEEKDGQYIGIGLANGIMTQRRNVWNAMEALYTIPSVNLPADITGLSDDYTYGSSGPIVIENVMEIDGREVARSTATYTQSEMYRNRRNNRRKEGIR